MAQKGIDFLINVNTGSEETPVWTKVAGQRGASLSRDAETLDGTTKDSDGWQENLAGLKSWSIEADGLLVEGDEGFEALEDAYMNSEMVLVQLASVSGGKYEGMAVITSLPIEAPYDDLATYTCTLTGSGKLKRL